MIRDLLITCALIIVATVVFEDTAAGSGDAGKEHSHHDELRKAKRVEKEIFRLEKALIEFEALTQEADTLDMPAERQRYRKLHNRLLSAMQRAAARANAHAIVLGREHMTIRHTAAAVKPVTSEGSTPKFAGTAHEQPAIVSPSDPAQPVPDHLDIRAIPDGADGRVDRMRELIGQSQALTRLAAHGNADAVSKNRAIVREFHSLMQADIRASRHYVERTGSVDGSSQETGPSSSKKGNKKTKPHEAAGDGD